MKLGWGLAALVCAAASLAWGATEVIEGSPAAAVRVVVYDDLQAPAAANFRTLLDQQILPRYGTKILIAHRDFVQPGHEWARAAAMAARWVSEQKQTTGIRFRQELVAEQSRITPVTLKNWVIDFAKRNQLDADAIVAAMTDPRLGSAIDQDAIAARGRGITAVPAIWVNGQVFSGTIVAEELMRALDAALVR